MSSLAATQADGYYIPPDYIESGAYKKKSLNQYNQSKGHNQYLQRSVVRFELPFDGFCTRCNAIVGKGTRFNTYKAHVDNYFSTKIYEFTTKCRSCGECEFKIRTNPKERTFDYNSGIRKKVEEFDTQEAGTSGVIDTDLGPGISPFKYGSAAVPPSDNDPNKRANVALHLLEKNAAGHRKNLTEHERMVSLLQLNSKMVEDADANAALRASFRKDRKAKKQRLADAANAGLGRGIELSEALDEDYRRAKNIMNAPRISGCSRGNPHQCEKDLFRSKRAENIFTNGGRPKRRKRDNHRCKRNEETGKTEQSRHLGEGSKPELITTNPKVDGINTPLSDVCGSNALSALADYGSESD